jgi:hypothetical protein
LLSAPGCYESLTDIVTPDKLVPCDDLVGDYRAVDPGTGRLTLAKGKGKELAYKQYDEKNALTNQGTLWVLKLGNDHFYQISVDGYAASDGRPVYAIGRLAIDGKPGAKVLTGYAFKSEDALFGDRLVGTAEYEHSEGGQRTTHRALSMPPEKLQAYLALRAAEMTEPTLKFEQVGAAK